MKRNLLTVIALSLVGLGSHSGLAQPANDSFANRITLSGVQLSTAGATAGGSREAGEPSPYSNMGPSVWYEWSTPVASRTTLSITGSYREVIGVYTGTDVNGLAPVATASAGFSGTSASLNFTPAVGTAYKILVSGRNASSGTFTLSLSQAASLVVSIVSPANGAFLPAGASIPISATASSALGPVTQVAFYSASGLIDLDTTSPYSAVWTNAPLGSNRLYAVATDSTSQVATSAAVNVVVVKPGVTITSPIDGATFANTNPITVNAMAVAASGSMTSVAFLVDGEQFGSDATSPFSSTWNGVRSGAHSLTAIGLDTAGNAYTSAPVLIAVAETLVSPGAVWKYLDNGSDQGSAWVATDFDDAAWASGPSPLGYGDANGLFPATTNSYGPDPLQKFTTTYYRHSFFLASPANFSNLVVRAQRDDGVILYLNGVEIFRQNMPDGVVTYTNFSAGVAGTADETTWYSATLSSLLAQAGDNVLAAEIHQSDLTSSDIWFDLELLGVPIILRNQLPAVSVNSPTNNGFFLAPVSISLAAEASDSDGSVAKVEFFVDGARLGETSESPYEFDWMNPSIGWHVIRAVATDDAGASQASAPVAVAVYDSLGTPLVQMTSPMNGAVFDAPTNLTLSATASAAAGLSSVLFLTNGVQIASDAVPPYSFLWLNSPPGTQALAAVAIDTQGTHATSSVVTVIVNPPVINEFAPTIASVIPAPGSMLTTLTSLQLRFSENVAGVNASDLLINGVAATGVSGSGSNYTFTLSQPAYGTVSLTWAASHGIHDLGNPSLPFDATGPGATWSYSLNDGVPPTILSRNPAAGSTLSNLTLMAVTFSEPVTGVNAADLLINNTPAVGLGGSGTSYTFAFASPGPGSVYITWAPGHGITDLSSAPFDGTGPGATWSYTLTGQRVTLVAASAAYRWLPGTAEASFPIEAWRFGSFGDSSWSSSQAPFYYDLDGTPVPFTGNTLITGMASNYTCIFARHQFVVTNRLLFSKLVLRHRVDDGVIVWLNGTEIARVLMASGEIPFNGTAQTATEPLTNIFLALPDPSPLVDGTNVLAVQGFNAGLTSTDFLLDLEISAEFLNPATAAPRVATVLPPAGTVVALSNLTVMFNRAVTNVDAADLLVNGVPANSVSGSGTTFTFAFPQPPYGTVAITWASNHGINDQTPLVLPFDATAPGATWQYALQNPNAPLVSSQSPQAGATLNQLTQIAVTFTKPVTGMDASDLLVNGLAAAGLSGSGATYTFSFPQPTYGPVSITWASTHGIRDLDVPANDFDATRSGSRWVYTLVDQTPPKVASQLPPAGAAVTNLTQVRVTFTEPVSGVDARDLLVNGVPATGLSGAGAVYTFTFPTPNATFIQFTWAANHGIADLAPISNPFAPSTPDTWFYLTPDTVPPAVVSIAPPPNATVRTLRSITVTFSEPVAGVDAGALLVNGAPAQSVVGSDAGPYAFTFPQPANGPVEVHWSAGHTITDIASEPNRFAGGEWTYVVDPNATFEDKVVINELMFNPLSGLEADEWIELHNVSSNLINLASWRFTRGIEFTFPNISLPAGGYLVVAANVATFQAKHPGVSPVVGGWTGRLANNDETLELVSALDEGVDSVHYAVEGDWARRERGHGADLVTSITRSGSAATVSIFGHDFTSSDVVLISGADQPEYNGFFAISSIGSATFNITVPGAPATPATGRIICRQVRDNGASGWSWFSEADGYGSSLELVNPHLPNTEGQNWLSSAAVEGTPGGANSVFSTNVAPLILGVTHFPPVPKSTDPVAITARVQDEFSNGVQSVTLFYRNHSAVNPPAFSTASMLDNGLQGDGVASDGLYGAILPAAANGSVIEFYVQATDTTGRSRTWPAPTWETNSTFAQLANALYQVDDEAPGTDMPFLRLVMSETERAQFAAIDTASDAEMNATFISLDGGGTKVRYGCGLRIRGAGSRGGQPKNYRLSVPTDNRWNNLNEINLNCRYIHAQLAGSALAQKAGLPCADARVVHLRVNGQNLALQGSVNFGSYLLVEPINADWAANHFPLDPDGNVYRASKAPWNANLDYHGTDPAVYQGQYGLGYYKASNRGENDWTDLFNLTYALSPNTSDANYVQSVQTNANVEEWLLYFAVCNFFDYMETSLCRGVGDDYAMYRGVNDPRFRILAHDFDTILGQGDTAGSTSRSIWVMIDNPAATDTAQRANFLDRFMRHPEFAPIYFRLYKHLLDTTFAPEQLNPVLDQMLGNWVTGNTIPAMKTFAASRRTYVLTQIPLGLTVNTTLSTQNGYLYTTSPSATLNGSANVIDTRRVLVNGSPAHWSAWEGRWTNTVTLQPGINRVLVQSLNSDNIEIARTALDIWYNRGAVQSVSGTIATDTVWSAAGGPYSITASLTVASGATLTIEPGTTVYLGSGVNLTVANGGRLTAAGTETAPVRFTRTPGTGTTWGGITVNGATTSPETRIAHALIEFNGATAIHSASGTLLLDHLNFGSTGVQYLSLDASSFVVQDCTFPSAAGLFEPVHGTGGIKAGGRGIFLRNFFGVANSVSGNYNDVLDFSGGNRPGPIVQFINNVFVGSGDDHLDLDSTDAWVEGNIFMHAHKNGSPDTASGVSGGADNADTSQITIIGNLFYDCDHAAMAKQGNFYTLINNTIVRQTRQGGTDTDGAVICLADEGTVPGAGMYLEGNIIYDAEKLVRNQSNAVVTFTNNLMPFTWAGPGGGNSQADPMFEYVPQVTETSNFTSWAQAQVMWDWFSLRTGSSARGTGPNGQDKGGVIQPGASIAGEPGSPTSRNSATLTVGVNRTGSGIPAAGFPDGSGYTSYRWRLDGGAWSLEQPMAAPITLAGLGNGSHWVEVAGRNDAGLSQDDPALGADAWVTVSRTWTIKPKASSLRLNEILASNFRAVPVASKYPDLLELYNDGSDAIELTGMRITDDPQNPDKFSFPAGASVPGQGYLVVYANDPDGTPGHHLGFNLSQEGEGVYLYDAVDNGGALLDSVRFGPQITDLSVGRLADGSWALTVPTFGAPNQAAPIGDASRLRINEWLAIGQAPFPDDFIELYNADSLPVDLGGLYLSDEILGWPNRHPIAALSFISGYGFVRFVADGNPGQGPEHLSFNLSGEQGAIGLYQPDLTPIDLVLYQAQRENVSQGRSPNGSSSIVFLDTPTPGAPNPLATTVPPPHVVGLVPFNAHWRYDQSGNDLGTTWKESGYNDSAWPVGAGILGYENGNNDLVRSLTNTVLSLTTAGGDPISTYYFRTWFVFTNATLPTSLVFTNLIDDGAVVYLNGVEVYRLNMASGTITASTRAASDTESSAFTETVVAGANLPLAQGTNLLAVELHQGPNNPPSDANMGLSISMTLITNAAASGAVVINEVLAANATVAEADGTTPDWIELYNQSAGQVDLADLSLTDDTLQPRRFVFAAGTRLAPGGYLRIVCDPNSTNTGPLVNTNFALKAAGGSVYLFDKPASGGSLLSTVTYGFQAADLSIGRVPDGSTSWGLTRPTPGAPNAAVPTLGNAANLRINEWMADPGSGKDDWFEIYNPDTQPVALGGLYLTDDLNNRAKHRIAPLSFLGAGTNAWRKLVADGNTGAGADHVNFSLRAAGEALGLSSATGTLIDGSAFGPQLEGVSEGRFPDGAATVVPFAGTDSPGERNYRWLSEVVINEVLTRTDAPLEDAIELHNLTAQTIDLGGWWLSDDNVTLQKFQIPSGTILPGHGFAVFYESQFTNHDLVAIPFALSSMGDEVVLSAAASGQLTGWRTRVKFGAADSGVSFGRYVTSDNREEFVALSARTFGRDDPGSVEEFQQGTGAPNALPRVGPVVITELMYHPPDLGTNDNVRDEFIELQNITTAPVALFDTNIPPNAWRLRDGVDFDFPPGIVIAPGSYLLVVSFDPANNPAALSAFRSKYHVDPSVPILGPYSGKLDNGGESIELKKPGPLTLGEVPYVLVEQITYLDRFPWNADADGTGWSLQRVVPSGFGDDPANWVAATPTPGPQAAPLDGDQDGMLDSWELAHGLDPGNPADAAYDPDDDGLTNLQEFQAGTDPHDPTSPLWIDPHTMRVVDTDLVFQVRAVANLSYTVEYTDGLGSGAWNRLLDIDATATTQIIEVTTPITNPARFFRLRTPKRPLP